MFLYLFLYLIYTYIYMWIYTHIYTHTWISLSIYIYFSWSIWRNLFAQRYVVRKTWSLYVLWKVSRTSQDGPQFYSKHKFLPPSCPHVSYWQSSRQSTNLKDQVPSYWRWLTMGWNLRHLGNSFFGPRDRSGWRTLSTI